MTDKPDLATILGEVDSSTFLGLSARSDLNVSDASSAYLGVPGATPYGQMGAFARNAPQALRVAMAPEASLIDRYNFDLGGPLFPAGCKAAVDCGDLPFNTEDFAANRAVIRAAVAEIMAAGVVPIVVGGDDSVPIPMLDALSDTGDSYTLLQIDAHIDWRDVHMGERFGLSSNMRRASEMAHITQIIQVGARGTGSAHSDDVQDALDWGAQIVPAEEVHAHGIAPILARIETGARIVICFDVDGLDPSVVPGCLARSPGGLSYGQGLGLLRGAAERGTIAAVDFAEFVPEMDVDEIGAVAVSRLVTAVMGLAARQ
ncbi:arginase [Pseudohalocynthiibacter aestuariivivens]|nr:arginase family protein [Pseudohalocynthiibacter aestuariivivens]QIE46021.1 arginase [Pseudohalocynthiibacter aestuariivivens]